jgi:hypothetical protein
MATAKTATFGNGEPYVPARWTAFFAWFIDSIVVLAGLAVGVAALAVLDESQRVPGGVIALCLLALVFVVPMLYGLCYWNGRALGALLAGTRLVRISDGGRIGGKAPWAMVIRTVLMPLVVIAVLTGGSSPSVELRRVSIRIAATRRLHAERRTTPLPQHNAPQHNAPQHTAPQHTAPQHTAPPHTASQHTAPQHTASQHTAPPHRL